MDRKGQSGQGGPAAQVRTLIVEEETGKNVNDFMKKVLRARDSECHPLGNDGGGDGWGDAMRV